MLFNRGLSKPMLTPIALFLVCVFFLGLATIPVSAKTFNKDYPMQVGATVGMVADIVRSVAGAPLRDLPLSQSPDWIRLEGLGERRGVVGPPGSDSRRCCRCHRSSLIAYGQPITSWAGRRRSDVEARVAGSPVHRRLRRRAAPRAPL